MVKKAAVLAALILMIFTVAAPLGVCAGDADTASQLLGDALKVELDNLTREQLTDILDMVDNAIEAIRNIGI